MGNRIRHLRQQRGLSVSGLARMIAVSDQAIRYWERGRSEPRKSTARRLARALGVKVEDLGLGIGGSMASTRPSVVSCYIVRDRRLLMTERRFPEGTFEWAAVSGEIESGETPEQAAIRETREEVGLEIEVVKRLGDRVHPATGRHLIYLAARVVDGTPTVIDHEENCVCDWADLETVKARWATLRGGIYPPVLDYLEATMGAHAPAMGDSVTSTPQEAKRTVAAAVIIRGDRVLMTKRVFAEGAFAWGFPAGKVRSAQGETPEQAVVREAQEELAVTIAVDRRLGERITQATGRHMVYFACHVVAGEPLIVDHEEIAELHWLTLAEADEVAAKPDGIFEPVRKYLAATMRAAAPAEE